MRPTAALLLVAVLYFPARPLAQRLQPPRQYFQTSDSDSNDPQTDDFYDDEGGIFNSSERGSYLGSPCDSTCNPQLHHVYCDPTSGRCQCEKNYPVKLNPTAGCGKPKKLGEQCYYQQSCIFADQFSSCIQVHHNAVCQCKSGYHLVSLSKPSKRTFCAKDVKVLTSDFSALAGVATGIAVLTGLICFVLRLFTQARSPRPRHFANANLAPPILFSSDTGIPLTVHSSGGRSTSRASSQRTFVSGYSGVGPRRASSQQGSRGVLVSASRAGAARAAAILLISCHVTATDSAQARLAGAQSPEDCAVPPSPSPSPSPTPTPTPATAPRPGTDTDTGSRRPSLASVHSSGSSVRSYSARRFEKEREQKEEREMHMRLAKMHSNSMTNSITNNKPPTPSPQSTDELLPSVHRQVPLAIEEECASTSFQNDLGPGTSREFR